MDWFGEGSLRPMDTTRTSGSLINRLEIILIMVSVSAFLSHATKDKKLAGELKEKMRPYGVNVFVAHDDLKGATKWMSELHTEINECEIFLVLLSENYHSSDFTDQELGMALSYGKPIIPICIDSTIPYGFMSQYQGIKSNPRFYNVTKIINVIMQHSAPGQGFIDMLISGLEQSTSFNMARKYAEELSPYDNLTKEQTLKILDAYNNNSQIYNSFMAEPMVELILRNNKKHLDKKTRDKLGL